MIRSFLEIVTVTENIPTIEGLLTAKKHTQEG